MKPTRKAAKPQKSVKTYVLDTNVLLHDPKSIENFEENTVVLPVEVLIELDRKKTALGSLGANARAVNRRLRELFSTKRISAGVAGKLTRAMAAELPNGGTLKVVINEFLLQNNFSSESMALLKTTLTNLDEPDHRILASALYVSETEEPPVILVTKDANMALKAMALNLAVEDYRNDRVEETDTDDNMVIAVEERHIQELISNGFKHKIQLPAQLMGDLHVNEYVTLDANGIQEPARYLGNGVFQTLPLYREFCSSEVNARKGLQMPCGNRAVPKNFEQWFLLDAILDPSIHIVTVRGKAGTGKTYIALAGALSQVLSERSHYERLYVSRPVIQMGKDIGALPGTKDEKLAPYIQPYFDNLEALFTGRKSQEAQPTNSSKKGKNRPAMFGPAPTGNGGPKPQKPYQWLLDKGIVEIEALTFIRGRSIANTIMIVDEGQNTTPHEAKTVATRLAEGSKLVFMGDPDQIDSPVLDKKTNGLVHLWSRLKGQAITAHIKLSDGVRSPAAELAANLL